MFVGVIDYCCAISALSDVIVYRDRMMLSVSMILIKWCRTALAWDMHLWDHLRHVTWMQKVQY